MKVSAGTDKGRIRSANEDSYYISDSDITFMVVADGMGGHKGGKTASRTAIENLKILLEAKLTKDCKDVRECLCQCVEQVNHVIYKKASVEEELAGMGTTLVLLYKHGDKAYVLNVGDSRCYHVRNGEIRQITKDHSVVQELFDSGKIDRDEMKNHPNKNIITRAVGTNFSVKCDVFELSLMAGDGIILCSDGLSNMVDDDEILKVHMSSDDTDACVKELIEKANRAGGTDNITVIDAKL